MSRQPRTLMEVIYARSRSFRKTGRIMTLIITWSIAQKELGSEELLIEDFIAWAEPEWNRRTVERQLREFREVFAARTPNQIAAAVNQEQADAEAAKLAPNFAAFA